MNKKVFNKLTTEDFINIAKLAYYDGQKQTKWDRISIDPKDGFKCGHRRDIMGRVLFTVGFLKGSSPVWQIEIYSNLNIHSMGYSGYYQFQPVANQMEIADYFNNIKNKIEEEVYE
jgi:hypothetical protein